MRNSRECPRAPFGTCGTRTPASGRWLLWRGLAGVVPAQDGDEWVKARVLPGQAKEFRRRGIHRNSTRPGRFPGIHMACSNFRPASLVWKALAEMPGSPVRLQSPRIVPTRRHMRLLRTWQFQRIYRSIVPSRRSCSRRFDHSRLNTCFPWRESDRHTRTERHRSRQTPPKPDSRKRECGPRP